MIRINLASVESRPEVPPRAGADGRVALACGGIVAGVLGFVLWETLALRSASNRLDERMRALDRQLAGFTGVSAQRDEVERQRADLARRLALTEALRTAQGAPVRMLDQVSRVLSEDVWLTELRQEGDDVTLTGRAAGMTALSDLVAGLESSGHFPPPIEIVDSRLETRTSVEVVHFELRARFSLPPS